MAAGTLATLDASLPGGLLDGSGTLRYAQTRAFTVLILFQLFNVFNARSDADSAFRGLFGNAWLWGAVLLSIALQFAVLGLGPLQRAFSTEPLGPGDWLWCVGVASSVLWVRELEKFVYRRTRRRSR
jgi:Ca2+-transporting ATPase